VLAVRTELIADATDVSRDAPVQFSFFAVPPARVGGPRDAPRSEIRRGSPDVSRDAPRYAAALHTVTGGSCGVDPVWMGVCRPPAQLWRCARTRTKVVRGLTFQNTFILMVQLRLKFGGIDVAQIGGDGMPLWSDQKQGGVDARAV